MPKPKSEGQIRVCVDMRQANEAIVRERHITPTITELVNDLNGAAIFSKLDLNQGYNQLELEQSSRYITTFSTHLGLWRYKRLNFGVSSAAEVFQNAIRETLSGISGAINISDDILVFGATQEEHDKNLKATFERLRECGLTLNRNKFAYNKGTLEFTQGCNDLLVVTDHKPLVKILGDRTLDEISNTRIFRLKQRTLPWSFDIAHVPGKTNSAADATSRHPSPANEFAELRIQSFHSEMDDAESAMAASLRHETHDIIAISWNA